MADIRSFFGPAAEAASSAGSKKRAPEPSAEEDAAAAGSKKRALEQGFARRVLQAKHSLVRECVSDVKMTTHTEVPPR